MKNSTWDKPVLVGDHLIFSPFQAHKFMKGHWAERKDADFTVAQNSILAALDGRTSPDEAREKFEAALRAAQPNRDQPGQDQLN